MVSMRVVLAAAAIAVLSTASVDARRQFGLHGTTSTADAVAARTVHGAHSSLWVRQQRADPSQTIAFKFILHPQTSVDTLDAMVKSVSDVASNSYGQYLSNDELRKHTGPSHEVTSTLTSFLTNHSDDVDVSANGDAIIVRMPIATAEKLFATTMFEYQHRDKDLMKVVRPHHQGFSVPSTIADHVMFIDGLESFPTPRQAQLMMQDGDPFAIKSTTNDNAAKTDILVTPGIIRAQYDVPDDIRRWNGTHPKNKLVVSAFLNEFYTEQDLSSFLAKYESRSVHKGFKYPAHTGDCIAGAPGSAGIEATGEASLDVQVTVSLSRSENIEMLCFQNNRDPTKPFADDNQEPFLEFMQTVNAMDPAPSVVSISYTDEECAVPAGYRDAVNLEFMKAALKGISIIISAGDAGVQGSHMSDFCHIAPCSKFVAMFPVSSPYVTAVGATSLDASSFHNGKYKERVTTSKNGDLITSGGGFSAVYAQPDYQAKAVEKYLKFADDTKLTPLFNPKGRAYPDITALGHSFPVFQSGQVWRTDGTSVSAPIIASLVTLLNKHRLEHGHSALGFLNPLIYKLYDVCPQVFRDITEGDIKCGGSGGDCCERGHEARVGWDAVSGVGTLKFGTLVSNLQQCIDKIKLQATNHVLLDDQEVGLSQQFQVDVVTQQVERVGAVLVFVAAVALVGFLVTVRRKLFPGRRLLDLYQYEPARQHLLADQE